ncbi:MAG: tRNA 2-selenouridine(34) synthase MnmH [Planctomycetota bacterium]
MPNLPDAFTADVPFASVDLLFESRSADAGGSVGSTVIDLRSPSEFADDHVPGAINVPLFEDLTRSFVGLLYKQFSPEAAFQEGRVAVVERVDEMVAEIAEAIGWEIPREDLRARVMAMTEGGIAKMESELSPALQAELPANPVVLHCARGGLRSRSVVALLRALGLERAIGMEGGYRAFRRRVMEDLAAWTAPENVVSLRGLTGVGKTLVLRAIERARPGWTMDLEGHAGHRSSLLGMVGLEPVSQKAFDTALWMRARSGFPDGVMVMEGESRKVGDVIIPARIWAALQAATNVEITASIPRRVSVLKEDYLARKSAMPLLRDQLVAVEARMERKFDLAGMLDRGEVDGLVEILLEHYYDPLYLRSETGKAYAARFEAEDEEGAAAAVIEAIDSGRLFG